MIFGNCPPINLENAEEVAEARRDGGVYSGCGVDRYTVYRGKRWHLVHVYSSGCDYGAGTDHACTHHGLWPTVEELVAYLHTLTENGRFPWWASRLLSQLEVPAEEA
jgi:hypothetical protein